MAIVTEIDSNFDSTLPTYLHSVGLPGFSHRYVAGTINAAVGAGVTSWEDLVSTSHATVARSDSGATAPKLGSVNGEKFVSFDGVADGLRSGNFAPATRTMIQVVRPTANPSSSISLLFGGAIVISRSNDNGVNMLVSGGATTKTQGTTPSNAWEIVMSVVDGNNSFIRAGATRGGALTDTVAASHAFAYMGLGRESTVRMKADVAEVISYDRALTHAELDLVMGSLIDRYGSTLGVTS